MRNHRTRRRFAKRSQMEIMGLMIVVILLIVGVLFAVKFIVLKKPADTRQMYTRTQLASNLAMAMLESTTAECRGTAVRDLLMDCGSGFTTITCDDSGHSGSCAYANSTLALMLNGSVAKWNTKYYVTARVDKDPFMMSFSSPGCTDKKPGESEQLYLPLKGRTLYFKVFICE